MNVSIMMILSMFSCSSNDMEAEKHEATSKDANNNNRTQTQNPKNPGKQVYKNTKNHPPNHNSSFHMQKKIGIHLEPIFNLEEISSQRKKTSIVLISLDTVRADSLSIYGGRAQVPNLEKMADRSLVFSQAISHFPETALSHWSMMTGVLPEVHGNVPGNGGSIYQGPTLAEIAKKQGYSTAAVIGGITMTDQASGFKRGFDVYDDQFPVDPNDMMREGSQVTEVAIKWLRNHREKNPDQPFFLFAHYFDAHFPYTPKPPYDTKYDNTYTGTIDGTDAVLRPYRDGQKKPSQRDIDHIKALYDGEISELDAKIAPLLKEIGDDCIVVVTSDHGESFEHGYYFNHRGGLWDGIVHVPLIIQVPEIQQKISYKNQIGLIDLTPTILDYAGLPLDKNFQGNSVQTKIEEIQKSRKNEESDKKESDKKDLNAHVVFSITDPWMPQPQFAVRTQGWKYIQQESQTLLYDLSVDPQETKSLSDIPIFLEGIKENYRNEILSKGALQQQKQQNSPNSSQRYISDEECQRLEALGYTTCNQK